MIRAGGNPATGSPEVRCVPIGKPSASGIRAAGVGEPVCFRPDGGIALAPVSVTQASRPTATHGPGIGETFGAREVAVTASLGR